VVVPGPGGTEEDRGVADIGEHLHAEGLPVEAGRHDGVADVEDGVVETADGGHGELPM
jgi:hypothetical protein